MMWGGGLTLLNTTSVSHVKGMSQLFVVILPLQMCVLLTVL